MVEVDGVNLENVAAVGCHGVDFFVNFAGVERCVVVVADGEGDGVGSRRLKAASSAHQMLCEGHFGVKVEVKSTSSAAPTEGSAAVPPARRRDVIVVVAVVGYRHDVVSIGVMSRRFEFVSD